MRFKYSKFSMSVGMGRYSCTSDVTTGSMPSSRIRMGSRRAVGLPYSYSWCSISLKALKVHVMLIAECIRKIMIDHPTELGFVSRLDKLPQSRARVWHLDDRPDRPAGQRREGKERASEVHSCVR